MMGTRWGRRDQLHEAGIRTQRALSQLARVRSAYEPIRLRLPAETPSSLLDDGDDLSNFHDSAYFAVIAIRQAVAVRDALHSSGLDLPPIKHHDAITHLRDLGEHWPDNIRGRPVRAERKWFSKSAVDRPGFVYGLDSADNLASLSGLPLSELEHDLTEVLKALSAARQEFETEPEST